MHTEVMGILNVTPDSFSDGGSFNTVDKALKRAEEMVKDGADIIDVGGESTRPGAEKVSAGEEIKRVTSVINEIKSEFNIKVSVDTYKAETALCAVEAGADIINDIGGLMLDEDMAAAVKETDVMYILTHNMSGKASEELEKYNARNYSEMSSGKSGNRTDTSATDATSSYVNQFLAETNFFIDYALSHGIKKEKLIIDPGIGFNKTQEQNIAILHSIGELCKLDFPVLLGASRKSVINHVLKLPVDERLEGTLATTALAVINGVSCVRVHDVKENVRFIKMLEAMI